MKILVTGAAGFVGSHTIDKLVRQGYRVVGVDNLSTGKIDNLNGVINDSNFTFIEADLTDDSKGISHLIKTVRPDRVLHLAALVSVPISVNEPGLNFRLNIELVQNLLEAARTYKVEKVVFASSAAVYGDSTAYPLQEGCLASPKTPYGAAKLFGEVMLEAYHQTYGLDYVAFRYFNIYGPRQDPNSPYSGVISIFVEKLISSSPVTIFGDGEQTRDFIAVNDVADFNVEALINDNIRSGCYNLCTGKESSLNELLACIAEELEVVPVVKFSSARVGDIRQSIGCREKLISTFSKSPQISLSEGISNWLQKRNDKN